jgi:hypothetical protein
MMAPFGPRIACFLLGLAMLAAGAAETSAQDSKSLKPVSLFMYSVAPDLGDAPLWIVPHALGHQDQMRTAP